jgi:hypothetical protein
MFFGAYELVVLLSLVATQMHHPAMANNKLYILCLRPPSLHTVNEHHLYLTPPLPEFTTPSTNTSHNIFILCT